MNNNNHYFETLAGIQGELTEERLIQRMGECQVVVNDIERSQAWNILLTDIKAMIAMLDSKWHEIPDNDPKLREMKNLKTALRQIYSFPSLYLQELEKLQSELKKIQNPDAEIQKDADNED